MIHLDTSCEIMVWNLASPLMQNGQQEHNGLDEVRPEDLKVPEPSSSVFLLPCKTYISPQPCS